MNNKKIAFFITAVFALSMILLTPVNALTFPSLPNMSVTATVTSGSDVYPLTIVLTGVPAGYSVTNKVYVGWCFSLTEPIVQNSPVNPIMLTSSFTDSDKINYLLNNQGSGTPHDIQAAIWILQGFTPAEILDDAGFTPSATAIALAATANANGGGFVPSLGQIIAVQCIAPAGTQDLLIQLTVPNAPGLTPGFWKNNLAVYLGYANGNRGYSSPTGADPTIVTKDTMAAFFDTFSEATLEQLYTDLTTMGNNAAIRDEAANVFNLAAGLATGPPWN